ncbi:hypothetical protein RHMOL_Rhmol05G0174500 [Rhododendron molle]|uniref:Uncharacterized protein n=1 Tax=Rhododendron molle TaxID=49168 RepID=A0ACC0NQ03_RHOML|nr:hypothetical protein RHMOL_Rhmol05G0174500 [Rhododendron molle]
MPADNTGLKLLPEGVNAAANLFALIVESELKTSAFIDESESEYLQASITAIDATIPLLTSLFSERFVRLHEVAFKEGLIFISTVFAGKRHKRSHRNSGRATFLPVKGREKCL